MFLETAKLALRAIRRNFLRSFLTVLGVVIGVAAVIAMVTIGNGTTAQVQAELTRLGTNTLFVRPGQWGPGRASTEAKRFDDGDVVQRSEQPLLRIQPKLGLALVFIRPVASETGIREDRQHLLPEVHVLSQSDCAKRQE